MLRQPLAALVGQAVFLQAAVGFPRDGHFDEALGQCRIEIALAGELPVSKPQGGLQRLAAHLSTYRRQQLADLRGDLGGGRSDRPVRPAPLLFQSAPPRGGRPQSSRSCSGINGGLLPYHFALKSRLPGRKSDFRCFCGNYLRKKRRVPACWLKPFLKSGAEGESRRHHMAGDSQCIDINAYFLSKRAPAGRFVPLRVLTVDPPTLAAQMPGNKRPARIFSPR